MSSRISFLGAEPWRSLSSSEARVDGNRSPQASEVLVASNGTRAARDEVIGEELDVEKREAATGKTLHQLGQRDLGGVSLAVEHRFGCEEAADRDSIDPACQALSGPHLDAVYPAELMELEVGGLHSGS